MLSTRQLCFRYQDEAEYALRDIDINMTQAAVTGLIGANGSGKSTLFMNLLGLLKPTQGAVLFNGQPLQYNKASLSQLRQCVTLVFQDPDQQIFYSNIESELAFTLRNLNINEQEINRRIEQALTLVNAHPFRHKAIQYLSYGQKKRIAIASALVVNSDYLLLDEPTAGLDPAGRQQMISIIENIVAKGTRVMISSHDIDLIYQLCDYLYLLHHGEIVAQGDCASLFLQTDLIEQAQLSQPWLVKLHLQLGLPLYKNEQQLFADHKGVAQ